MFRLIAVIAALCLSIGLAGPLSAKELFRADLKGSNVVPSVDTKTRGRAELRVQNGETQMEITLRVKRGTDITMAHIHCAAKGANGPVVVWLAGEIATGLDVNGKWIGRARFGDDGIVDNTCGATVADLAQSMRDGNAYVNVHSVANPAGEIRGQLKGRGGKK